MTTSLTLPTRAEGDAFAERLITRAAPDVVAVIAQLIRAGAKLPGITVVVSHRDAPFAAPHRAQLRAANRSFAVYANTPAAVASALREAAAGEAAETPPAERLYGHYATLATELKEGCAPGCVRVLVCMPGTTRLLDVDLKAGAQPDPVVLDGLASRLAGQLQVTGG